MVAAGVSVTWVVIGGKLGALLGLVSQFTVLSCLSLNSFIGQWLSFKHVADSSIESETKRSSRECRWRQLRRSVTSLGGNRDKIKF